MPPICPVVFTQHKCLARPIVRRGLNLVAEGVETLAQMRYLGLENSACNVMQGYYYHKPMQQLRILELIRDQAG